MREYRLNGVTHLVYDDINEVPAGTRDKVIDKWWNGEIGDWVVADDGAVMEILRKGSMGRMKGKDRLRYNVGTVTGTYPCLASSKFTSEKKANVYSFGGKFAKEYIKDRKTLTKKEQLFVQYLASGMSMQESYLKAFPTNDSGYALNAAKTLITTERVKTAMRKELEPVMEDLGITPEYVLGTIKDMVEVSEREETKLKAIFKLADVLDLEEKSKTKITQVTGAVFKGFSDEELKGVERPVEIGS